MDLLRRFDGITHLSLLMTVHLSERSDTGYFVRRHRLSSRILNSSKVTVNFAKEHGPSHRDPLATVLLHTFPARVTRCNTAIPNPNPAVLGLGPVPKSLVMQLPQSY